VIYLHWIRDSKLHCKSVEPCFVTLGSCERKIPKPALVVRLYYSVLLKTEIICFIFEFT